MPQEGCVGDVPGFDAGHIERLAVAVYIAAQRRQQRVGCSQVGRRNASEVAPRQRGLAGAHRQAVSRNHPGAVVGLYADVLVVESELYVMPAMLPRCVVRQVIRIGSPPLRLKLVDRIGEQGAAYNVRHIALRVQEIAVGQIETAANFIRQRRGRRPAPGHRHQVGMGRIGHRRHQSDSYSSSRDGRSCRDCARRSRSPRGASRYCSPPCP